ncbi:hypothetical protein O181_036847 [Austropuccinia psidii MF-1]|uniref:Uncharacterized protein n=1 Tax=Austropuccinia psidii MF-1 TaxID=1389203 RepID=A0A9Q3DBH6_9BASI|nr:hypothetical protein [Austropuccinia psidii MF-1]
MVGRKVFDVNTLTKVLAFYVLQSLPSTLQMTANNIYQSTEISGSIPTLDKVLSEIEISLSWKNEQSKVSFNALRAQENKSWKWKCQNRKHDPTAPHSEEDCFELHPEKLEAFRARKIGRESKRFFSKNLCNLLC